MSRARFNRAALFGAVVLSSAFCISSPADNLSDQEYTQRRQRDDFIDEEKQLLKEQEAISTKVFNTKRDMNDLAKKLAAEQSQLDSVRHQLITLHMKLMP